MAVDGLIAAQKQIVGEDIKNAHQLTPGVRHDRTLDSLHGGIRRCIAVRSFARRDNDVIGGASSGMAGPAAEATA
jgi:hypothetical protein